jgi:hypothetical protein
MRASRALAVVLVTTLVAAPALAAPPDAAAMLTAVQLADEAGDLFQAGKFADALDRYKQADAIVRRHTIGLRIARCLAQLGRLAEAAERYESVARMPLPADLDADKLAKQKEAQTQAESERDALLPRIPGIVLSIDGPVGAAVTLDGQPFPPALYGVKRSIDPGAHRIEARLGAEVVSRDVVVKEGEVVPVTLQLHAEAMVVPSAPAPPPAAPPPPLPAASTSGGTRVAGFVLLGVGSAGLVVGLVAGGVALGKKSDLQEQSNCGPNLQCPARLRDQANAYNTLRPVSSVGFIAGGVLAAAGIVLVATSPLKDGARTAIVVGSAWARLEGAF